MMLQGTWPFAKLEIYDDYLEFSVASATRMLRWDEIDYCRRLFAFPFMADGIVIIPKDRKPRILLFWSLTKAATILSLLKQKGVNTQTRFTKDVLPFVVLAYAVMPIFLLILFAFSQV